MKVSPLGSCRFEKGDWVEIVGNIPFPLKDKPRPIIGRVTHVNGAYVLVRPKYQHWEAEFYHNELQPSKTELRKLKLNKINGKQRKSI